MKRLPTTVAALLALVAGSAAADPGYYVVTPYARAGQGFVDLRYWTVKPRDGGEVVWPEVGLGWGVTRRWTSELFASGIGPSPTRIRLASWNWQNDFLLSPEDSPVDVALHTQLVHERGDGGGRAIVFGPVLQTDLGLTQLTGNLLFERTLGAAADRRPTRLKYQWQLRHRVAQQLRLGAQGFGELGPWDDWAPHARQSHRAGPALFGTAQLADGRRFEFQAAWLVGKTYAQRGHMFTARAVLGF